jgi:tRNA A37 threonylcarbamoyladenosine synthetase subunit TsaC/SUA5/YrdC
MAVSSANRSGLPPATTIEQARQQLADQVGVFLDGGPAGQLASTIVDLTADDPVVLREGAVTAAAIGEVLGQAIHVAS